MPIRTAADPPTRCLRARVEGKLGAADLLAHLEARRADNTLALAEVLDAREATTDLTSVEVQRLADWMRRTANREPLGPLAIVASDPVLYGMARMYALLCDNAGAHVEVFRAVDTAEAWLASVS